jgi:hypothetical protein
VKSAPIVTAAVAYDDPSTGNSIGMVIHQAMLIKGLELNILCPMQMRHSGITVNERPKHCTPTREHHAVIIPDGSSMIPLSISGVMSYFPSRKPPKEERDQYRVDGDYLHFTMFNDLEMRSVNRYGVLEDNPGTHPR